MMVEEKVVSDYTSKVYLGEVRDWEATHGDKKYTKKIGVPNWMKNKKDGEGNEETR